MINDIGAARRSQFAAPAHLARDDAPLRGRRRSAASGSQASSASAAQPMSRVKLAE